MIRFQNAVIMRTNILIGEFEMSKAFSNLLKHIDELSHTDKERVFQWVKRYVEPSSLFVFV